MIPKLPDEFLDSVMSREDSEEEKWNKNCIFQTTLQIIKYIKNLDKSLLTMNANKQIKLL